MTLRRSMTFLDVVLERRSPMLARRRFSTPGRWWFSVRFPRPESCLRFPTVSHFSSERKRRCKLGGTPAARWHLRDCFR
jgi:hypothetical protein